jgi:galactose mutarotase-like enzyme
VCAVVLRDGELEATVLPELGMVVSSLRHRGAELLAQRGGPDAYARRGSTFGIPLLHPWANRLSAFEYRVGDVEVRLGPETRLVHIDGDTGLPIHGLLAASPLWRVRTATEHELSAELEFSTRELLAAFPFPHRLAMRVALDGPVLRVELTMTPTEDRAVPVAFGFHPYLTLPASDRREWEMVLPVRRRALLAGGLPTGEHEEIAPGALDGPLGERTFDDSFDRLADAAVFILRDATRTLELRFESGFTCTQVYAPEGSQFICFEPMTAPVDALRSGGGLRLCAPGSAFAAAFSLRVGPGRGGG